MCLNSNKLLFVFLMLIVSINSEEIGSYQIKYNETPFQDIDRTLETMTQVLSDHLIENSSTCSIFKKVLKEGLEINENLWIVQMFDAWSKIPSGILAGNVRDFGNFDECYNLEAKYKDETIKGQYCATAIKIDFRGTPIGLSVCIPDSCQMPDLKIGKNITLTSELCQTKPQDNFEEFDWSDWVVIGVCTVILLILLISTCYDVSLYFSESKPRSPLLIAFSVFTNGRKLFAVSNNTSGQVTCLNGMRTISLIWIVGAHRFIMNILIPIDNLVEGLEFKNSSKSTYISSARTAVDTFFYLSGFLLSFNYFKTVKSEMAKAESKGQSYVENPLTLRKIPKFYIHRLFRLTPPLVAVFFLQITILRRFGSGPLWPSLLEGSKNTCTKWWWTLFLYVQNYVNYDNMCLIPTWYLSADMQMFLLSPLIIIPMGHLVIKKKKKLAYIAMLIIIVLCIVIPLIIDLNRKFIIDNIYETHPRLSIYTLGLLFGMIVIDFQDKKIKIPNVVNLLLWIISLGAMLAIIITMSTTETHPEKVKNHLFFSFTRPVWSIGLGWIIFACHYDYGGPVNWFLSKTVFQIMTRLSYSMYLLHGIVILGAIAKTKETNHFSEYANMYSTCGDYIFTVIYSIIWVLCFESPIVVIEKYVFSMDGKKTEKPLNVGDGPKQA